MLTVGEVVVGWVCFNALEALVELGSKERSSIVSTITVRVGRVGIDETVFKYRDQRPTSL